MIRIKPEKLYPEIVMGSYIEDLIGDIERNMKSVSLQDPYFEQLSVEKFALETLLQEISRSEDVPPAAIAAKFVEKMNKSVNKNTAASFTFSVARDAAQSILDGLFFDI